MIKPYLTRRGIKKLIGKTVIYDCAGKRTVIVDWVEFDGKHDRPQFGGLCKIDKGTTFGNATGHGVWGYVEDIIEVKS